MLGREVKCNLICMVLILALSFFSGCRTKTSKIIISFMDFESGEVNTIRESLFRRFEQDHPQIKVRHLNVPYGGYEQKILTMTAGGKPPDIFLIYPALIPDYISKGILYNITAYLNRGQGLSIDDFFPTALEPYQFDGKILGRGDLYGLPKDWSCENMLYYNKDLFDEAGITYPDGSWSPDSLLEASRKLTKRSPDGRIKQYGFGLSLWWLWQWIYENGGGYFTADLRRCVLDSKEAIEAIRLGETFIKKYHVSPNYSELKEEKGSIFEIGRVAIIFGARYNYPVFQAQMKNFNFGVAPPLKWRKGRAGTIGAIWGYGMSAKTQHPDEAWQLMQFLAGEEAQRKYSELGYNMPTLKSVAYSKEFLDNPNHPAGVNRMFLKVMEKKMIFGQISPYIPSAQLMDIYSREMESIFLLGKDVEAALKDMVDEANKIINNNLLNR